MGYIESAIDEIKTGLKANAYTNEAGVSQGIVIPILRKLNWNDRDLSQISPQHNIAGKRVDYALLGVNKEPCVLIEVKRVGRADDLAGERQIFEYAFHYGTPLVVLSDGRIWNFYLPVGQGHYKERRICRLDLIADEPVYCQKAFVRYLDRKQTISGQAYRSAREDYDSLVAGRKIPEVWGKIVFRPDSPLVELVQEEVRTLFGTAPSSADVTKFLRDLMPPKEASQKQAEFNLPLFSGRDNNHEPKKDWQILLEKILSKKIAHNITGYRASIGGLIETVNNPMDEDNYMVGKENAKLMLAQHGLRVRRDPIQNNLSLESLLIAYGHPRFYKLLGGNKSIRSSEFKRILKDIPGAELTDNPVRFAEGKRYRCIEIPLSIIQNILAGNNQRS